MLYISLIFSAVLLIIANLVMRTSSPVLGTVKAAAAFVLLPALLTCILPALALQALLLVLAHILCSIAHRRRRAFFALSCAATVIPYLIVGWTVYQHQKTLREEFPFVSVDARLPPRKGNILANQKPVRLQWPSLLDSAESTIEDKLGYGHQGVLRRLHEDTVETFVNQPGFGVVRMSYLPEILLRRGVRTAPPIAQPVARGTSQWSAAQLLENPLNRIAESKDLADKHYANVLNFLNVEGFGFFKDREHVAGFQSHQFSESPSGGAGWRLQNLDLVGLAMHDEPVAYVSDNLPRMDELREAPTRPLDAFEQTGLEALRNGEDLIASDMAHTRRMLGALRSTKQCLSCHGGERGELLGAFSYTLVREPSLDESGKSKPR